MRRRAFVVAMAVVAAAGAVILACTVAAPLILPRNVPAQWRDVRASSGHKAHVGKLACSACHGEDFKKPAAELCESCHAKTTPLHPPDPTTLAAGPSCIQCHGFGAGRTGPWDCMKCHQDDRGHARAVGAHADEDCSRCHQPHGTPATTARTCTDCHSERQTKHAGLHGCLDCHSVHEGKRPTLASVERKAGTDSNCETCHTKQTGKLHVDQRALSTGHVECTSCHQPHEFTARPCADCHKETKMIASPKHTCIGCHDQHVAGEKKTCVTCHRQQVAHPKTPEGQCVGCHRPHQPRAECESCHALPTRHDTAKCLDCHEPHKAKPQPTTAFCARCHTTNANQSAGHSQCITCHASAAHAPSKTNVPACATCHTDKAKDAGKHVVCATCHKDVHAPAAPKPACATCHAAQASSAPKKLPACATCHTPEAKSKHGQQACATCHQPHGPDGASGPPGPPKAPACASCHPSDKRTGLHRVAQHTDCATCHQPHGLRPADDRATCTACHKAQVNHEPKAVRCATCHPF
jgi:hypothetical protein